MTIWFKDYTLEELQQTREKPTLATFLDMEFTELGADYIVGTLPVNEKTKQIHGILHGGATCVLTETLGSVASLLVIDPETKRAVGSMITTNHLRPTTTGKVTAICRPIHLGKSKHVWDIKVYNDEGKITATTELTCAVIDKR